MVDMSAQDHLGPQFYHATDARLRPGSVVTPPAERNTRGKWEGKNAAGYTPERVYVYGAKDDQDFAHNLMHHHGAHHYQVEPLGDLEPDPDPTAGNVESFMTTQARVVRKMKW